MHQRIQVGFLGAWIHIESKIAPNWSFRTEIRYESPLISGLNSISHNTENGNFTSDTAVYPIFIPMLSIEPRWYYNSPKRQENSRNTFIIVVIMPRYQFVFTLNLAPYLLKKQKELMVVFLSLLVGAYVET